MSRELHELGSVTTIVMGLSPKGENYNRQRIGLPLLNGPTEFGPFHPNCTLFTTDSKRECERDDLIFCVRGNTTGRMNWADQKYSLGRGVCSIRGATPEDTKYIRYCIEVYLPKLLQMAGGSTMPTLTQSVIKQFRVPYPASRNKIVSVLSAYDDLIENNSCRIKILEEMAQRIYREWFVDFRFPGHEKVKIVDSPLGMIPEGWEVKTIGDIIEYHIGGGWGKEEKTQNYVVPAYVIRGTDIPPAREGKNDNCPLRFHTESNFRSRKLQEGDIVFEVSGGSKNQPLGRTLLVSRTLLNGFKEDVICASFCKLIRPNRELVNSELLYLHLLEIYDNREITQYQVQSTGISNFKFSIFLDNHKLIVPGKPIVDEFGEIALPIYKQIQVLGKQNSNLRRTRVLLLPKLISGELDVSELDIETEETIIETPVVSKEKR